MPPPPTPISRDSRASSPPIALEVTPSRRAFVLWALFALVTAAALCFGPTPSAAWRLLAALTALALGASPAAAVLFGRGPHAVRRFEWRADGTWWLDLPNGTRRPAALTPATSTFGPWILLAWAIADVDVGTPAAPSAGPRQLRRRRYALIEERQVGQVAFRTVKGRLARVGSQASRSRWTESTHPHGSGGWRGDN